MTHRSQHFLFGILNWGLGHAARSMVVIDHLIAQGHQVTIASSGIAYTYLNRAYPNLAFIELPDYGVAYSSRSALWGTLKSLNSILHGIENEHYLITSIFENSPPDVVISDNRYGVHLPGALNIFIGHQYHWPQDTLGIVRRKHNDYLEPFSELWIPDFEPPHGLSGNISKPPENNKHTYIGPLSRIRPEPKVEQDIDVLFLLSGLEPLRTLFEDKIIAQQKELTYSSYLIRGTNDLRDGIPMPSIDLASKEDVQTLINRSKIVISQSGYSTIMDLAKSKKKAGFIPTKGMPEQQYLARFAKKHFGVPFQQLDDLNISQLVADAEKAEGFSNYSVPEFSLAEYLNQRF